MRFRLVPKSMTVMTLNDHERPLQNKIYYIIHVFFGDHHTNLNEEDRPILSTENVAKEF